jgi:replicative DNA helicase
MYVEENLPQNIEAERLILGSILLSNEALPTAMAALKPQDFFHDAHRRLFARMMELSADGQPVDLITLSDAIAARRETEAVGGVAYLSDLTSGLPFRSNIAAWVELVKDKSRRREMIQKLNAGIGAAQDQASRTELCISTIQDGLLDILADSNSNPVQPVSAFVADVYADVERLKAHRGEVLGKRTGITTLDISTTGFRDGEFVVIGGWAGTGKTALAIQSTVANLMTDVPVLWFSIEMRKEEILKRIISHVSGVKFSHIREPRKMTAEEHEQFLAAEKTVSRLPLFIDDSGAITDTEVSARARLAIRRNKVQMIYADYLQLMDAVGRDTRIQMTRISKSLRLLAKQEGVPVIALSQLTRPMHADRNARPTMFHLKESGSLEADAHLVLLLFRPVHDDKPTGQDEIVIAKQRSGIVGTCPVVFDPSPLIYRPRELWA